jgi:hypothetical protein
MQAIETNHPRGTRDPMVAMRPRSALALRAALTLAAAMIMAGALLLLTLDQSIESDTLDAPAVPPMAAEPVTAAGCAGGVAGAVRWA